MKSTTCPQKSLSPIFENLEARAEALDKRLRAISNVRLRKLYDLTFLLDEHLAQGRRIENDLRELRAQLAEVGRP